MNGEDSRRDFIKKTSLLAGGVGLWSTLPASIQKALKINPKLGSTFEDAEHIVLLMQENRSFDHCFGALNGVRGFNDPRAIALPNGNPVWLQSNKKGETYTPFHLDIKDTKITWMGGLPHSWGDQLSARNNGKYDNWLNAKRTGYKGFEGKPMTLGYYKREDIPFNYAMADAFTVCDHHFCSSLTGTTPNRLYFFSGALRKNADPNEPALVRNEEADYSSEVDWATVPEMLEENGISWKVYQNEISLENEMNYQEDFWLGNFTDNPLEFFTQYHVRRSDKYKNIIVAKIDNLKKEIQNYEDKLIANPDDKDAKVELNRRKNNLLKYNEELDRTNADLAKNLSPVEKDLHDKAFYTNSFDPNYHSIETVNYDDKGTKRKMQVPKSDVLAGFRKDVKSGKLPSVSWLVAPQAFSDHPSAPWFGAWYVSEALDILTENPEVWKKTIFILTYDENDGYFDHLPPFVAPDYKDESTGKVSESIKQLSSEYVTMEDELKKKGISEKNAHSGPIGLGYRVPFIVASPWSRGGYVNSQIFDHTSVVQLIEGFVSRKVKKDVKCPNVTDWRRAICGDLHSVFRPYNGAKIKLPKFLERNEYVQQIDEAKYKPVPEGIHPLVSTEIEKIKKAKSFQEMREVRTFFQENGLRNSNILPYELYGNFIIDSDKIVLNLSAATSLFGKKAAGAPFTVYAFDNPENIQLWNFTVAPGDKLDYNFTPENDGSYHFNLYGPNGFYRACKGNGKPNLQFELNYKIDKNSYGKAVLIANNTSETKQEFVITDPAYGQAPITKTVEPNNSISVTLNLDKSFGWYDLKLESDTNKDFHWHFAGRIDSLKESFSDPLLNI
ncbi:phosphocholine-specific phospholipase C [Rhizosphaericola mali]|uniref:phospholipase C n=1 Tax=Rhizosphaericola mali TaxID=2545455 RepID=A0A5P2FX34_9BACT|nr:phospholipase C, phosphocholine-specific [Rhizosphaericola mali]QES87745.1 phospholipase C, phosphocholine-specific [Rhizosphaericola mali]